MAKYRMPRFPGFVSAMLLFIFGSKTHAQPCAESALRTYYVTHNQGPRLNFIDYSSIPEVDSVEIDLRRFCPPVLNQGREGSCNSWALGYGYMSFRYYRDMGVSPTALDTDNMFSPQYIFNLSRCLTELNPGQNCRTGTGLLNDLNILKIFGCCRWKYFPYNPAPTSCFQAPEMSVIGEGMKDTISSYAIITFGTGKKNFNGLIKCFKFFLSREVPIVIVMERTNSLGADYVSHNGIVRGLLDSVPAAKAAGLHTSLCVGYRDSDQTFLFLNQFGPSWGENGYIRVPYRTLYNDIDGAFVCTDKIGDYSGPLASDTSMLVPYPSLSSYRLANGAIVDVAGFKVGLQGLSQDSSAARFLFYDKQGNYIDGYTLVKGQSVTSYLQNRKISFTLNGIVAATDDFKGGANVNMTVKKVKPNELNKFNKYLEQANKAE
ncbi:MAG: C1 family peptidase [Chitinophagales bacterium]